MNTRRFAVCANPAAAVDRLVDIYDQSLGRLRQALLRYAKTGEAPGSTERGEGAFAYPELRLIYAPLAPPPQISRAFGKLVEPGVYAATITRPAFFRGYLLEQLELVSGYEGLSIEVGPGPSEIPYAFAMTPVEEAALDGADPAALARLFPPPDISVIDDAVADGEHFGANDEARPLSLFDGARVDYSLNRLRHYTGADPEHVQQFILLTNYHRYVDEFVRWGVEQLRSGSEYETLSTAGGVVVDASTENPEQAVADAPWRRFQMPAYHLTAPDRRGVTLVNIGVGPSNAKTITDHLAVLRPQCWLMIGHCGGLRHSQRLGDYVLAHAYMRRDHVLDDVVPGDVPIPPIAEIQVALQQAASKITGDSGDALKRRLRTGTVVTDDDRNWELRSAIETVRFNQSRAIAIDMESGTVAANGFRFRVPYGTLLCVSDKPLHGQMKLPGPARRFYEQAVSQHLRIGIAAIELLKRDEASALHSRKLRAFDEPPFR